MAKISIIIPTLNEEGNIKRLVNQLSRSLRGFVYELIFVDDRSDDRTVEVVKSLSGFYPIKVVTKKGQRGKAMSLLQGFKLAKYELIGIIDADLQYPPSALPKMISEIDEGAGVVVANRLVNQASWLRRLISHTYQTILGKWLHGLDCDVQSGLKVFRKSILAKVELKPTPWTFDLEFLLKARSLGYKIASVDVKFSPRRFGVSKINLINASWEIGWIALKLKFAQRRPEERGSSFTTYTDLNLRSSALYTTTIRQRLIFISAGACFGILMLLNWHLGLVMMISLLICFYFFDLLFNLFLVAKNYTHQSEIRVSPQQVGRYWQPWPKYTILCPLYKEAAVLPQFIKAISRLDYPKNRLEVLLLLEEDDRDTIQRAALMDLPKYFQVVVVPDSQPKTKPKACNYGLSRASGDFVVIYDAEDIPEVSQLKKAVIAFEREDREVACIQAKLNYYNPHQNILTKLFTCEYSLWFDLILPGLQSIHAPIPLGGTSNHFRTEVLRRLSGWDPFNVTEDADLGMRLFKLGYRTSVMDSVTMEEANSQFKNWFRQRSRWIKGYMQTFLVHMRSSNEFYRGEKGIVYPVIFYLVIGGKVMSILVNPLMWLMTLVYFSLWGWSGQFIQSLFLKPFFYMAVVTLVMGNFLYLYYYMLGAAKRNLWGLVPFALLTPLYWLMMSSAAVMAAWELLVSPFYWHKTLHGLHLEKAPFELKPEVAILPT